MHKPEFHIRSRWWLGTLILCIVVLSGIGLLLVGNQPAAQASNDATVPYSHHVHVDEVGINCEFCHSSAHRSPQAGLPSLQRCMTCHAYFTLDDEPDAQAQIDQVISAFEDGQAPRWPDVYRQPDFVYFSHRPHLAEGVACETCHGDVANMDLVTKQVEMNMGFCLNCHRQQAEDQVALTRLIDCTTCHQ